MLIEIRKDYSRSLDFVSTQQATAYGVQTKASMKVFLFKLASRNMPLEL